MLKVGITGGIGTGKSTVARVFSVLGIPVYEADERAKVLMEEDTEIVRSIRALFGNEAYFTDGKYNRAYVAGKVFGNPELLLKLNATVHPAVGRDFERWAHRQHAPYVLKEAAIMSRSSGLDRIIVVSSSLSLRIERIKTRDGRSEEQIENIIRNQKTEEEFLTLADFVISNNEEEFITTQVLKVDAELRLLAPAFR
ncbi:dephospho-CoA kinase [Leadbetterella sp. DM7]|uniref:dephospho-CoA kinase n=1 Tax=Leadbetterella sp. DM7 TaxID=3235085 RepID=UPI00349F0450